MRRTWPIRLASAVSVLVTATAVVGGLAVRRNLPDRVAPPITGLSSPVSVTFDDRGVATVTADSLGDALRVQGYLTARDRLFQLDLQRRAAAGQLASVFGRVALPSDREHRTLGFARVAAAALPLLPATERESLVALTDGINAFLASHAGKLGLEYVFLEAPRRFEPSDALLVYLLMNEDLSSSWKSEAASASLEALPASARRFLLEKVTRDDVLLVPDSVPLAVAPLPEEAPAVAVRAPFEVDGPEGIGSNGWVVSGALTASGRPMLANDPHLAIGMPSIWLPMRFVIAGRAVEGVTLPGLPGVVIGRNESLAWGFTNLGQDVQDLYRETIQGEGVVRRGGVEPLVTRVETIAVRGSAPESLVVRESSHGPLVKDDLALRWAILDPGVVRVPTASFMLAADEAELQAACDSFVAPGQNVVWATKDGSIGWRATGLVPIRRPGTDGSVPYDGRDPENDWRGFVPASEMPRVSNPPSGYLVTANQRVIGTSFPYPVATAWPSPARARRIRETIETARSEGRKLDRAAFDAMQRDVVAAGMRDLLRAVAAYLPADLEAGRWEGRADRGDPLFPLARALRIQLRERLLATWKVTGWRGGPTEDALLDLARSDDAAFRRAGLGSRDAFLGGAVDAALADVRKAYGTDRKRWSWGEANPLATRHPLGRVPGLSWVFDPPFRLPMSGAPQAVRVHGPSLGQSMRWIVDWGDPEASTLVVPFGVSGHVGSPHRLDQLRYWRDGDPGGAATRLARTASGPSLDFRP